MNALAILGGATMIAVALQARSETVDSANCKAMKVLDQCHIGWQFSRSSVSFYFVQQFDPLEATWRTLAEFPASNSSEGAHERPVEAGYLYRVLACDDAVGTTNCSGSTMVWAPFVQPQDQAHLIPSRVPLIGSEERFGEPVYGLVIKKDSWLSQVTAYNVIQMTNAIARANVAELPEMTPVNDIRVDPMDDPIEQVQFNVFWFYSGARGVAIDQSPPPTFTRPPHDHPWRHPQEPASK